MRHIFACYFDLLKQFAIFINSTLIQHPYIVANFIFFWVIQRVARSKQKQKAISGCTMEVCVGVN